MPQSLSDVILHTVFPSKNREPWIDKPVILRLHADLATMSRNLGCETYSVGGVADHVHLALRLGRTIPNGEIETRPPLGGASQFLRTGSRGQEQTLT